MTSYLARVNAPTLHGDIIRYHSCADSGERVADGKGKATLLQALHAVPRAKINGAARRDEGARRTVRMRVRTKEKARSEVGG